jgi:hypothetical protein
MAFDVKHVSYTLNIDFSTMHRGACPLVSMSGSSEAVQSSIIAFDGVWATLSPHLHAMARVGVRLA